MNRLANESSPYLRQHRDNPVDWFPWGAEAFEKAKAEDKPLLISIGYSACHWCHVMAHESFEDDPTAAVMNDKFVNVKVDREERPDVDAIYMEAVQAMSGSGGWPMTVFITPAGAPFFAGTYFPKEPTQGHPGFVTVLEAVADAWRDQKAELLKQGSELTTAVAERVSLAAGTGGFDANDAASRWTKASVTTALNEADPTWGGFGRAPKFPHVETLDLLLAEGETATASVSLDAMAAGGIYDQLGGGFSRYSVDAFWMVPHFEKMLYDNAGLIRVYLHAYQATGEARFRRILEETVTYVLRDLRSPEGAFYSAEDADSEGEEGKFYTWRQEEIASALDDEKLAAAVHAWFGTTKAGNFEGSNILHRPNRDVWLPTPEVEAARKELFAAREQRVRPGLDDKVLTEWNAMMIASLAEAGAALDRADWLEAAETAMTFLVHNLRDDNGRWLRSWHSTTGAKTPAFASDYAWTLVALTKLREATGIAHYLTLAEEVAQEMKALFLDTEHGGFYTVGSDGEQLIVRAKDLIDSAYASANGTAAHGFARLFRLTGKREYETVATNTLALVADAIDGHPTAFVSYLAATRLLADSATETVIAGDHKDMVRALQGQFRPNNVLLWGESDSTELWAGRNDGAFVCRNFTCHSPVFTTQALLQLL